jgi:DNA-binding response OmpR family regulator
MGHVLILEPDRQMIDLLQQAMALHGHTTDIATGAQDGIFCLDEKPADVVITELQLVGHSGIEFLYEMQSYPEWQQIPVVIYSNVPPTEFNHSIELMRGHLGVKRYCYKPQTTLRSLLRTVDELVPAAA